MTESHQRLLMTSDDITRSIQRMAHQVWEQNAGKKLALVGLRSRGATLAKRLKPYIEEMSGKDIPLGVLDTGLYRDDIGLTTATPEVRTTDILFDVEGLDIILVDDVLYTGRTVRAALNALIDLGRPNRVELLVLIDREGLRELPIQADFAGKKVKTYSKEKVNVHLREDDGEDSVIIILE